MQDFQKISKKFKIFFNPFLKLPKWLEQMAKESYLIADFSSGFYTFAKLPNDVSQTALLYFGNCFENQARDTLSRLSEAGFSIVEFPLQQVNRRLNLPFLRKKQEELEKEHQVYNFLSSLFIVQKSLILAKNDEELSRVENSEELEKKDDLYKEGKHKLFTELWSIINRCENIYASFDDLVFYRDFVSTHYLKGNKFFNEDSFKVYKSNLNKSYLSSIFFFLFSILMVAYRVNYRGSFNGFSLGLLLLVILGAGLFSSVLFYVGLKSEKIIKLEDV